ncbi:type VI secretion system baseplate subunit TssG [Aquicoccus sp. G2-2]|uniref:type VI secretion system baseplate subunit TssG n=1 Tax=Aquicoccus sp. G2-2 TaxID=3092120 RepID=UPI002ADFA74E|nr:type VI secretion system baseplate subunit TssG [Aquicoccus sp. G2-2]MEA1114685.1 type VI secretion system baseplate subunit TssG [Aquicoccus sp. G2-2]
MADDPRHARSDLSDEAILSTDFFELLRQLETTGARFGRAGGPGKEPARLGQIARLNFAASDVVEFRQAAEAGAPPFVGENVIGLIGPEGPMPLHMTRWIMQRLSNRWFAGDSAGATSDTSFIDFLNMLQHRMIALYWRAWAEARPDVHIAHGDGGRIMALMRAMAGIGLPGTWGQNEGLDGAKLHHATSLAHTVKNPERLTSFLETVVGVPVTLDEFIGVWIDLPVHLQTRLGAAHCGLGTGAVSGARVFDRQSQAELRLGPLSYSEFETFLDDPAAWARLRHSVIFASGKELRFRLRLVLAAGEVPQAQLGTARLGKTAWLAPDPTQGADDFCVADLVRDDGPAERSAA